MIGIRLLAAMSAFLLALVLGVGITIILVRQNANVVQAQAQSSEDLTGWRRPPAAQFDLEVLVNGHPLAEYYARGKTYIEALKGAEYELRVRNPTPYRVAVALSVDGLNTIDARHTSAWNASKWVIYPYQSITIPGWQMSTERARHFYFTDERDSYGAKLGQTANLGNIEAVIFRERRQVTQIYPRRPAEVEDGAKSENGESAPSSRSQTGSLDRKSTVARPSIDDYAATGIGRSVHNDVRWIDMDLEPQPAAHIALRYEYYSVLLRLGVLPRPYNDPYPLKRREDSRGFSPEPN